MRNIADIRFYPGRMLGLGNYRPGYQAILDFDYLSGKSEPSIAGIVTAAGRFQKYFWGTREVLIPCFTSIESAKTAVGDIEWMFNVNSGRRAAQSTRQFFQVFPDAAGGHIFAEDVPEKDALELYGTYQLSGKTIIGPAGVGLLVPGYLKLGVVGGVDYRQLEKNSLMTPGSVAVLSASGGMINEIITQVASAGHTISFALCFGGDRFPTTTPKDAFLAAEADDATTHIVYYGELGGQDEYELADLIKSGQMTKPVFAYIAGVIGENFDTPVQFGHAKALAGNKSETASAKRQALKDAGAAVALSMADFAASIASIPTKKTERKEPPVIQDRKTSLFSSTISRESDDGYEFVGSPLQQWAKEGDMAVQIGAALLGKRPQSQMIVDFIRTVFLLSVDHGPQVSGALNTIVTARAGKGLVDSLAAGLLTIGPRFGGAVSDAAGEWFTGVTEGKEPAEHVESYAKAKKYIGGIGHKKYRLGLPDPRTDLLAEFADKLPNHRYFDYAKAIEAITTAKKGNLILNVDGHIAALMLDILETEEHYDEAQLRDLISADFFNALFVIPRTVGFVAHYLDQKRLDEGLFRLPDDDVLLA
ncbi:MAG TPA: citrate/2-methylcitrate synthase [Candidatus Saccharibacteria bacterium]|nr:citrate/2-methylcitrate synthase [Candidatus Saccharibacteria bacterium]HRK93900.1 citrate/2-methylcitrate synthase [Candidatus Saccharibacteria bacterium]